MTHRASQKEPQRRYFFLRLLPGKSYEESVQHYTQGGLEPIVSPELNKPQEEWGKHPRSLWYFPLFRLRQPAEIIERFPDSSNLDGVLAEVSQNDIPGYEIDVMPFEQFDVGHFMDREEKRPMDLSGATFYNVRTLFEQKDVM